MIMLDAALCCSLSSDIPLIVVSWLQLILELCRSEETADLQIIQPHLDRMQSLKSLWKMEVSLDGQSAAKIWSVSGCIIYVTVLVVLICMFAVCLYSGHQLFLV